MLGKEEEEGVVLTERVLIEEHGVGLLVNLALAILIVVLLLLHLLLRHDLFVVQIHVEQDLSRVFFQ